MAALSDLERIFYISDTSVTILEGRAFEIVEYNPVFAATEEFDLCAHTTDAGVLVLNSLSVESESTLMFVEFFEEADWTDGTGTIPDVFQINRLFRDVPLTATKDIRENPTITTPGNLVLSIPLLGTAGSGNKTVLTTSQSSNILAVLDRNTKYCIRIRNAGEITPVAITYTFGRS